MPRKPRSLRNLALSPKRSSPPRSPSPTFTEVTRASDMNFGADGPEKIITRSNLKTSLQAYDELMTSSANYRAALLHMSKVTAAFADAIEKCAGLKGPSYEASTRLQAASGLHHLVGNHWHVLAETLDKNFEKPLRQHLDTYRTIVHERSASYEKALREKSNIIRQTEMSNLNRKQRNLQSFREALTVLQQQVNELDALKSQHYQEIMEHEEEVWDVVQAKVCVAVRSTMDVFDRFTAKASDPVLEHMLQSVPDPFDSYGPPQAEDQIFTILPPLAVIANTPSPSATPLTTTPPPGAEAQPSHSNSSWAAPGTFFPTPSSEWADTPPPFSGFARSPSPSSLKRRQSHPPTAKDQSRKADSKLRSVVALVDETDIRHPPDASEVEGARPQSDSCREEPPPEHDVWAVSGTSNASYDSGYSASGETTPRRPTLSITSLDTYTDAERSLTSDDQSDHTVQLVT
ncbi:hypothetical protein M404DRAFT_123557 [Pisolithus tinctorius Marx 270]|uniref:IMD domain-containing protein n=1 Tax=Pisolithus tinctorius Marx 270 TaxID=870435 RepID=A0A0C3JV51_PISTI|nr:hypothetical protein M404DRAFT_123557 [Pisolithus tinctorius Marx 270]